MRGWCDYGGDLGGDDAAWGYRPVGSIVARGGADSGENNWEDGESFGADGIFYDGSGYSKKDGKPSHGGGESANLKKKVTLPVATAVATPKARKVGA